MIAYRAMLDVPCALAQYVGRLLRAERRALHTRRDSRALTCFHQAVFALRWFRDNRDIAALARDHGISRATGYRYLDEAIRVLAAQAPDLHEALQRAGSDGASHLILDGKLFASDRLGEQTTSAKGRQIDAWYSGKAHEHGGNIQALSAPDGFPLWVSEVEPGSVHDMRAARAHVLAALYWAASQLDLPTLADSGYAGAGIGVFTRSNSPPTAATSTWTPAPTTPCCAVCAAWANAASHSSSAAGARSATSPPAPARSVTSSKPRSCSPISSTDASPETR